MRIHYSIESIIYQSSAVSKSMEIASLLVVFLWFAVLRKDGKCFAFSPAGHRCSCGVYSDGSLYGIPQGVIYSVPCVCKGKGELEIVKVSKGWCMRRGLSKRASSLYFLGSVLDVEFLVRLEVK